VFRAAQWRRESVLRVQPAAVAAEQPAWLDEPDVIDISAAGQAVDSIAG
jgi:hypothetical protein